MTLAPSGPLPPGPTLPLNARELLNADGFDCVVSTVLDNNPTWRGTWPNGSSPRR
jgi:hypothetical protein